MPYEKIDDEVHNMRVYLVMSSNELLANFSVFKTVRTKDGFSHCFKPLSIKIEVRHGGIISTFAECDIHYVRKNFSMKKFERGSDIKKKFSKRSKMHKSFEELVNLLDFRCYLSSYRDTTFPDSWLKNSFVKLNPFNYHIRDMYKLALRIIKNNNYMISRIINNLPPEQYSSIAHFKYSVPNHPFNYHLTMEDLEELQ